MHPRACSCFLLTLRLAIKSLVPIFIDGTLVIVAMLYLQALHANLFTCCFKVTGGYAARFVLNKLIRRVARDQRRYCARRRRCAAVFEIIYVYLVLV